MDISESLHSWLRRVCLAETPPESIVAYNIGLFEGETGYCAYLVGAVRFDETDEDWACDEAFVPSEKYCELPGTKSMDWKAVETCVLDAAKEFVDSEHGRNSFLASADALTVGFDSGNLARIK